MTEPGHLDFQPARLRLARTFWGWTMADLGEQVSASRQYVHQLEGGVRPPSIEVLDAIAFATKFDKPFFFAPVDEEVRDDECHLRSRRTTPGQVRTRVASQGTLFNALVRYLDGRLSLPKVDLPSSDVKDVADVERAAEKARLKWGLTLDAPIKNITRVLESYGAVVTTFWELSAKVDAFSWAGHRPIVVRNVGKGASRARFDLAHECGHLVMHAGVVTGSAETEGQADRFASAFLLPRAGFAREFPRSLRWNWPALFALKKRWGASVSAIARRAFDLGLVDAVQYRRACIHIRSSGWHRGEPDEPIEEERPEVLQLAFAELEKNQRVLPADVARSLCWELSVLERVTNMQFNAVAETSSGEVVSLDRKRAERKSSPRTVD